MSKLEEKARDKRFHVPAHPYDRADKRYTSSGYGFELFVRPKQELMEAIEKGDQGATTNFHRRLLLHALGARPTKHAENVVIPGCSRPYEQPFAIAAYFQLLHELGIEYNLLDIEYCCGALVLYAPEEESEGVFTSQIWQKTGKLTPKDYKEVVPFIKSLNQRNLDQARAMGAKRILHYCTGCLAVVQKLFKESEDGVSLMNALDILIEPLKKVPLKAKPAKVGYFQGCYKIWNKVLGDLRNKFEIQQYKAYRSLLDHIEGIEVVDIPPKICCKDDAPGIAKLITDKNVDYTVTPCYACRRTIEDQGVKIKQLHELLLEAVTYKG